MIERDNRDIQFTHLAMENVRLQNLVLEYEEELRLRDVEDAGRTGCPYRISEERH